MKVTANILKAEESWYIYNKGKIIKNKKKILEYKAGRGSEREFFSKCVYV